MGLTAHLVSFQLLILCFASVYCEKTPALIWSSSRPLSDLSDAYVTNTVDTKTFVDGYLTPLTSNPTHSLVVFVQNKLSVEDFTRHADVYNPNSDGGAFKNVKTAMDENFSVNLPAVTAPVSAIEQAVSTFKGQVIRVDNPADIDKLQLSKDKAYLIVVNLQPVNCKTEKEEYHSFQNNDEMIGKCMHHLSKRGIKYSAVYTAQSASFESVDSNRYGRQLMAAEDGGYDAASSNGTLYKSDQLLFYLQSVNLTIYPRNLDNAIIATRSVYFEYSGNSTEVKAENGTISVNIKYEDTNGTTELDIKIQQTPDKTMWKSSTGSLTYTTKDTMFNIKDMVVDFQLEGIQGYCFHCGKLVTKPIIRGYNVTEEGVRRYSVSLILNKFQIQPLGYNSSEVSNVTMFSSNVWDCVEFFTIPIWMGLLVSIIIISILFLGISMLANITTMDRFDDPKGKTITVTVNE